MATAGLEEAAVNGPEDEGWLVRLMEITLQSTTINGVSNHGSMDAESGVVNAAQTVIFTQTVEKETQEYPVPVSPDGGYGESETEMERREGCE